MVGGCGTPATEPEAEETAAEETAAGGDEAEPVVFKLASPWAAKSKDTLVSGYVFMRTGITEGLVGINRKAAKEPVLAESWEVADDKLTWTFKLRPGVK
jgi:ABC-type transport system substrate-binding protein